MKNVRSGFTLIELLFVIVILGIVGGIALETIRQYYDGIYRTQIYTQRVSEADHILQQVAKYFENAISDSLVNMDRDAADSGLAGACNGTPTIGDNSDYTVAFVGVNTDSLRVGSIPGWSEKVRDSLSFSDINNTQFEYGTEANLAATNSVMNLANAAVYNHQGVLDAGCDDFNWGGVNPTLNAYFTINTGGINYTTNVLTVTNHANSTLWEERDRGKKYLLDTGYAFRALNDGRFMMYYNFRPWKNNKYIDGNSSLMGREVASFSVNFDHTTNFSDRGGMYRLKLCMRGLEQNLSASDAAAQAICREKRVHVRY